MPSGPLRQAHRDTGLPDTALPGDTKSTSPRRSFIRRPGPLPARGAGPDRRALSNRQQGSFGDSEEGMSFRP